MHDDMADLLEQANEIQESLGRSYAVPDEIDEADLEAGTYHTVREPYPLCIGRLDANSVRYGYFICRARGSVDIHRRGRRAFCISIRNGTRLH